MKIVLKISVSIPPPPGRVNYKSFDQSAEGSYHAEGMCTVILK